MSYMSVEECIRRFAGLLDLEWAVTIRTSFMTRYLRGVRIRVDPTRPRRFELHAAHGEVLVLNLQQFSFGCTQEELNGDVIHQFTFISPQVGGDVVMLTNAESVIDV